MPSMWRCLDFEACRLTIEVLEVQRAEKDNDDAARASHVEGGASAPNTGARSSVRVPCCDLVLPYVVHVGADTHVRQVAHVSLALAIYTVGLQTPFPRCDAPSRQPIRLRLGLPPFLIIGCHLGRTRNIKIL